MKESYSAQAHWCNTLHTSFRHPGNTRWWTFVELLCHLLENWEYVVLFVNTAVDVGDVGGDGSRITTLKEALNSGMKEALIKFELGVISIFALPLVRLTYILEGDRPCSLIAHNSLVALRTLMHSNFESLTYDELEDVIYEYVGIWCTNLIQHVDHPDYNPNITEEECFEIVHEKTQMMIEDAIKYVDEVIYQELDDTMICRCTRPQGMQIHMLLIYL